MDALHTEVQTSLAQAVTPSRQLLPWYRPHGDEGVGPEGQGGCNTALWPNFWGERTARVWNVSGWRGAFCRGHSRHQPDPTWAQETSSESSQLPFIIYQCAPSIFCSTETF